MSDPRHSKLSVTDGTAGTTTLSLSTRVLRHFQISLSKLLALFVALMPPGVGVSSCQSTHSPGDPVASKPSKLQGQQAPAFTLRSDSGADVSTSDFAGKSKLVVVFYRGYW
jgi:cytochrome oxidase Cu insertion factor (SCO1/SenC/PrrC family)